MAYLTHSLMALALVGTLAACEKDVVLTGQRFEVRTPLDDSAAAATGENVPDPARIENRAVPIALPGPVANADWTHRAGSARHLMPHLALSAAPQPLWVARIGAGNSRRARITTAPVVSGGTVFAQDAAHRVSAVSAASGAVLWTFDAVLPGERAESAGAGGLAVAEGKLFITTGFGELIALSPADGSVIWRQRFDSPVSGAPTVSDGTVYVSTRDGAGWAVAAADGKQKWVLSAVPSSNGFAGPAAPAVSDSTVIFPFGSGELVAATRDKGNRAWVTPVAGRRPGRAVALVTDITGDPVVAGKVVYAGTTSGRTVALDLDNGTRLWEAPEGAQGPVWPVSGAVFLVNDEAMLVRLDASSGDVVWKVDLPFFVKDTPRRQRSVHTHFGPVLAGGRLMVASSDGQVRFFAPDSGVALGALALPGGAAAPPAVAGGTIYVVTTSGQLHAFR